MESSSSTGVFALRRRLDRYWDLRVWIDIDPEVSLRRAIDHIRQPRVLRD